MGKIYVVTPQSPYHRQMTLDELLDDSSRNNTLINSNKGNTRTNVYEHLDERIRSRCDVIYLIDKLTDFNDRTKRFREVPRQDLYHSFKIPKKSKDKYGHKKYRRIDAPNEDFKDALRNLKCIFEEDFGALYHTSAFAYVKGRCAVDAVKRHQSNESKWFAKFDLTDFFGSTTIDFVMNMFSMVFPFSEVVKLKAGEEELRRALDLAFLNGGLPQGTPISPIITNIMMIPIDYVLYNSLRDYNGQRFVYTRYADDFLISSKYDFKCKEIEKFVKDTLASFSAPFTIQEEKTRYGSSAGSNWNLGVMLNKDNNITIGHKRKREFKATLFNYAMDRKNGVRWDIDDMQALDGYYSYYKMIEGDVIDQIVDKTSDKVGFNIIKQLRKDIQPPTDLKCV